MIKKNFVLLFALLLLINFSFSYSPQDTLWKGYIVVELDKEIYQEGENITGGVVIYNEEYFPAFGQTIALQVGQGEHDYPSQFANDNIIEEVSFSDIWILPRRSVRVNFSLSPKKAGNYHIDAYAWTLKSILNGADTIYIGPRQANFVVEGNTNTKNVLIDRKKTKFNNTIGPVGFPVEPKNIFSGKIYIINNENAVISNTKLVLDVCDWSCSLSESIQTKTINIGNIDSSSEKIVDIEMTAPEIPSAYEINMTLYSGEEILSIYKNRVISSGGTAKFRKIYLSTIEEGKISLEAMFTGSPDHFNYPDFENFKIDLEILSEKKIIEEQSTSFEIITTEDILVANFDLKESVFDEICLYVKKNNIVYEKECFSTPMNLARDLYEELSPEVTQVSWNYSEPNKILEVKLNKSKNINGILTMIQAGNIIYSKEIQNTKSTTEKIELAPGQYILVFDDIDAKQQVVKDLFLGLTTLDEVSVSEYNEASSICTGQVCADGFVCDSTPYTSIDGACCTTQCVPSATTFGATLFMLIPMIFWIAVIILIVAIFVFRSSIKKARGKKK